MLVAKSYKLSSQFYSINQIIFPREYLLMSFHSATLLQVKIQRNGPSSVNCQVRVQKSLAPSKGIKIRNPEYWKFLPLESGILSFGSGIQLQQCGIPLTFGIRNPSSTKKDLESGNWNPESTAWNPESKTVLDSLTWRERSMISLWNAKSLFSTHYHFSDPVKLLKMIVTWLVISFPYDLPWLSLYMCPDLRLQQYLKYWWHHITAGW